jgi:hypothetical protein
LLLDVGGSVAIAGLCAAFMASAIRNTRALYAAEPLPRAGEKSVERMVASCL